MGTIIAKIKATLSSALVFWIANILSFIGTAYGIMGAFPNVDPRVAFIVSGVLQSFIVVSYRGAARAWILGNRLWFAVTLIFGIGLSATSGTFASSAYLAFSNPGFLQRTHENDVRAETLAPISKLIAMTDSIQRRFADYADFAAQRASDEEKYGNTCEGQQLAKTCGLICRWRKSQSDQASSLATTASSLRSAGVDLGINAAGAMDDAKVARLFRNASALVHDDRLQRLRNGVSTMQSEVDDGFYANGKRQICIDKDASTRLADIAAALDDVPTMPLVPETLRQQNVSDSVARNLPALWKTVKLIFSGNYAVLGEHFMSPVTQAYLLFWIFSFLLIEPACGGSSYYNARRQSPYRGIPPKYLSGFQRDKFGQEGERFYRSLLKSHRVGAVRSGRNNYFFVNKDGDNEIRERLEAYAKGHCCLRCTLHDVEISKIPDFQPMASQLNVKTGGGTLFDIYRFPAAERRERFLLHQLGV